MPTQSETTERNLVTEVEELLAKATPEPWFDFEAEEWLHEPKTLLSNYGDAVLIARAPELLRRLKDEVIRLRGASTDTVIQKIHIMQEKYPGQRIELSIEWDGYCYVTRSDGNGNAQPIAEGATLGDVFED